MRIKVRFWLAGALAFLTPLALPGVAAAAVPGQSVPGESNLGFLLVGMLLAWGGFFAYTFYLSRKTRELRREIDELREQLGGQGGKLPPRIVESDPPSLPLPGDGEDQAKV